MGIFGGIIGDLIKPVTDIVSKTVKDKDEANRLKVELQRLEMETELKLEEFHNEQMLAQIDVNKVEAAHRSIFIAGWRPFIGWAGGGALVYNFILFPFISLVARLEGYTGTIPAIETDALWPLLAAMLGVGAMRSFDKSQGTSNDTLKGTVPAQVNTSKTVTEVNTVTPMITIPPEDAPWTK